MRVLNNIWEYLLPEESLEGLDALQAQRVSLSLVAALVLIPFALVGMFLFYSIEAYASASAFAYLFLLSILVTILLRHGLFLLSRMLMCFAPPFVVLAPVLTGGVERIELYLGLPYIFIGLSMLPVILLDHRREPIAYWSSLAMHFIFVVLFDRFIMWTAQNSYDDHMITDHYLFYKVGQVLLAVGVNIGLMIFLQSVRKAGKALADANEELVRKNAEIQASNEKIRAQNKQLGEKQRRVKRQFQQLQNYYNELLSTKKELLRKLEELNLANAEISTRQAETSSVLQVLRKLFLVVELDKEGKVVRIDSEMAGAETAWQGSIVGKKISEVLVQTADASEGEGLLQYLHEKWPGLLRGEMLDFDTTLKSAGGDLLKYHFVLSPVLDAEGAALRVLAVGQDITDLVRQKERIEQVNYALSDKMNEIEQKNILLNFQQNEIFEKNETLQKQREEIQAINESLEQRVRERTRVLEEKNRQLAEYAFINSHILRAPLSSMMGLIGLMKYQDLTGDDRRLYTLLLETAQHLDDIVNKINTAVDSGAHFDRTILEKKTSISDRASIEKA